MLSILCHFHGLPWGRDQNVKLPKSPHCGSDTAVRPVITHHRTTLRDSDWTDGFGRDSLRSSGVGLADALRKRKASTVPATALPAIVFATAGDVLELNASVSRDNGKTASGSVGQGSVFGFIVKDKAAVLTEEGSTRKRADVTVEEVQSGVKMNGGWPHRMDAQGVGGCVMIALYVAVGRAVAVLPRDLCGKLAAQRGIAALFGGCKIGVLFGLHRCNLSRVTL